MKFFEKILRYNAFQIGIFIARLWLGAIMMKHSISYLFGGKMGEFTNFLIELGFPAPGIMAYLTQWTELVTAVLIIIGLRVGAIILTLNMGIAIIFAHKLLIFTEGELAFNYFTFALVISLLGTGKYGLDQIILNKISSIQ